MVFGNIDGKADLPEIMAAGISPGCLAHSLHGWQQQGNKHADDRDHDEQFDEREALAAAAMPGKARLHAWSAHGVILRRETGGQKGTFPQEMAPIFARIPPAKSFLR